MPLPLLPNVVDVTKEALLAQSSVTALVSTRIYDRVPAAPTYPLLVVTTVDEAESPEPGIVQSRVQVDVWGRPMAEQGAVAQCSTIARTLIAAARDLRGAWSAGRISNAVSLSSIPQPDPSGRMRIVVDLQIEAN